MSKNILYVESGIKLKLELDNVLIEVNGEKGVHPLRDIECIIVDNLSSSISIRLLSKIAEFNIPLIVCSEKHLPTGIYYPIGIHSRLSKNLKKQITFLSTENDLWQKIIKNKIINQARVIDILFYDIDTKNKLEIMADEVFINDDTNKESFAAKLYFNRLMETSFSRGNPEIILNSALDYAYAIIRSTIAKNLIGFGINTQLGLHHKNEYNSFNLADDLIEPFRPIVDLYCYKLMKKAKYFTAMHRKNIIKILYTEIEYDNKKMKLSNAISTYIMKIASFILAEENDKKQEIIFPDVSKVEFANEDYEMEEIEEDYELLLFGEKDDEREEV